MDKKSIREYAKLMKELELSALEITEGDKNIRLERQLTTVTQPQHVRLDVPEMLEEQKETPKDLSYTEVTSPMVGVFYAAPTEDSDPFVSVGDEVKKGDILCIVEAMKLMNEITADCDGRIAEVCLSNGDVVEYGTVLFRLER